MDACNGSWRLAARSWLVFWTNGCGSSNVLDPMEEDWENEEAEVKTCSLTAKRVQSWSWYLERMMCWSNSMIGEVDCWWLMMKLMWLHEGGLMWLYGRGLVFMMVMNVRYWWTVPTKKTCGRGEKGEVWTPKSWWELDEKEMVQGDTGRLYIPSRKPFYLLSRCLKANSISFC